MVKTRVYRILSSLNELKWNVALKGILSGMIAGLLVVLYRLGIEHGNNTAVKIFAYLKLHPLMIFPWIIATIGIGLLISWLIKLEPMASGSGIPQVKGQVLYGFKMKYYSILLTRFFSGIISSFYGLSLGREGPSIQIGACGSQAIAKKISKNKIEENYLITGGAAAGLSAAFNAPLSGIVFALEEIHRSFSPLILIAATTASLTADTVSKYFFGLTPVLSFTTIPQLPEKIYWWLLPLGIVSGLAGVMINKSLLGFQTLYNKIPLLCRPAIALLIALPCGLFIPQVLGGGQNLVNMAEKVSAGVTVFIVLAVVKLLFTSASFGSGIPGGIFMPILSFGALSGSIFGLVATHFGLPSECIPGFVVCSMAGALSGAVKAPVTSILLTAEMTGSLVHLLPVAACSFIALFSSDILKAVPIYEALLDRIVGKNIDSIKNSKPGSLLEIPIEFGSIVAGKTISEVDWPEGTLVVSIHRGDKNIIPKGDTQIVPGDYLIIVSYDRAYDDMHTSIRSLCHANC